MIINQDGSKTHVDEDRFVRLARTRALNGFNGPALRAMYRWYEQSTTEPDSEACFDAYAMARQWRELDAQTLVDEFGLERERGLADATTVANVCARLAATTTIVRLDNDHYLVRIASVWGPDWYMDTHPAP